MDETPFYKRPWFYIVGWLAFLLLFYGAQIYRMGGIRANLFDLLLDLVCIFPLLLVFWMAFFAQFVLPVRTFSDRQKIFDRLITYLLGGHGPAMFIENGIIKEHSGERLKKGPGVLWLDSASAAVTRTPTAIKQTLGPGVHFMQGNEYIAGTVDLHIQSHSIGPKESDRPFAPKDDAPSDDEYQQIQDRAKQVSGLTRDGIEIIPRVSVNFRVNTGFPTEGQPGSRFGYRKGVTKKDKQAEKEDMDAIRHAILGEGVNPMIDRGSPRHRIAWNQLPVLLAVDLWREYAAKFTLDELFLPSQIVPAKPPDMPTPTAEEIGPLSQPVRARAIGENMRNSFAVTLHRINNWMERTLEKIEGVPQESVKKPVPPPLAPVTPPSSNSEPQKRTALWLINEMVKLRLTQPDVPYLDDHGRRGEGTIPSPEFQLLQERGLKVLSVNVGNLLMNPTIEDTIIRKWSTSWLKNAKTESEQIERKKNIIESAGRDKAYRQYAEMISREVVQKKPQGVKDTLKTLLMWTRTMIFKNDQLRRRMTSDEQDLEDIIKWIEVNEP